MSQIHGDINRIPWQTFSLFDHLSVTVRINANDRLVEDTKWVGTSEHHPSFLVGSGMFNPKPTGSSPCLTTVKRVLWFWKGFGGGEGGNGVHGTH